jgi:hypothetical protein
MSTRSSGWPTARSRRKVSETGSQHPPAGRCRGEAGQAGLLVALLVLGLAIGAATLTAVLGGAIAERTRARTAADAAALAGVTGGRGAADSVAAANGGRLESYRTDGVAVEATVVVGSTRASARAVPAYGPEVRRPDPRPSDGALPTRSCSEVARRPDPCPAQGFP